MKTDTAALTQEALSKRQIIEQARTQLKQEFVGIDTVIDRVLDAVAPWFLFPNIQNKPTVINLWGLTGVGKTSLVRRLVECMGFEKRFYRFNMSDHSDYHKGIQSVLKDVHEHVDGEPLIIALDEFQHARTINEVGEEIHNTLIKIIWELIDTGKIYDNDVPFGLNKIITCIRILERALRKGITVTEGRVRSLHDVFYEASQHMMDAIYTSSKQQAVRSVSPLFVPQPLLGIISTLCSDLVGNEDDLRKAFLELDGADSIRYLKHIRDLLIAPKEIDCSRSLIFVIGNLDEVYRMHREINPDVRADALRERSLEISIPQMKEALHRRFRSEQIARLGNIHILYPAFDARTFHSLIALELHRIAERIDRCYGIRIEFDSSIRELVYDEGVYPAQGARPVLASIHQIINTKLSTVFYEMVHRDLQPDTLRFYAEKERLLVRYVRCSEVVDTLSFQQDVHLKELRKGTHDDLQAITAVHESGHAVLMIVLLRLLPEEIRTITTRSDVGGMIDVKQPRKFYSKQEVLHQVATMLGGIVAERIIFGDGNETSGAGSDLEQATGFAAQMLKQMGFGSVLAKIDVKDSTTNHSLFDVDDTMNAEVKRLLLDAQTIAEQTLHTHAPLLLHLADYLSDNPVIHKDEIMAMVSLYAPHCSVRELSAKKDLLFYRKHLKERVREMEGVTEAVSGLKQSREVVLNGSNK